jgi:uncharacterized protein with FMN-binding domain
MIIALIGIGVALTTSHPELGRLRGVAPVLFLLAVVIAIGMLSFRPWSWNFLANRRASGQRVPKNLVSLSSAAILAIYAAGYHRTSSAEDKFAEQAARRRTAVPFAASTVAPEAVKAKAEVIRKSPAPVVSLGTDRPLRSPDPAPRATPAVTLTDNLPVTPDAPPRNVAVTDVPVPPPAAPPTAERRTQYKDGTYTGWGTSRHGDIQASVVIQGGQIASAEIVRCLTRYPCVDIADLPPLVVSKQSADVDYVSGATESSYAFADAVTEALSKANE